MTERRVLGAYLLLIGGAIALSGPSALTQRGAPPPAPAPSTNGAPRPGTPAPPPATNAPKPPTAIVRGYVTAAIGGRPLRGAQVNLISAPPAIPAGETVTRRENRSVASEADGRFEFKEVPAGRYRISASKTGYVTFEYGQRVWNQPGTQIEVVDTQLVDHIDFALQRGGVIVVTATNPLGESLPGAQVQAMQWGFVNGRRQLMPATYGETNDLGQARLYGLSPGEYFVSATAPFGNVGSGNAKMSYASTYYPGTLSTGEAQRVPVNIAEETSISLPVMRARLATVSGRAVQADGTPISYTAPNGLPSPNAPGNALVLRQEMPGGGYLQRVLTTKADGSFSLPNLLPGHYEFQIRPLGNMAAMPRGTAEFAQVPITVAGEDITNLAIVSRPGATLSGQLLFDTGTPPTDRPQQDFRIGGRAYMVDPPLSLGVTTLNPDWSFDTVGVAMTGSLRMVLADTGWNTKEVIVDGKDVAEVPMTFEPGREYKDIRVVLTQKRAEVNGTAIDAAGRPVKDFVALLFAQDRARWMPRSQSAVLAARSDQNGQFRIQRMPGGVHGSYYIIALDALAPGEEYDFELLARLAPSAEKITLGEAEVKTIPPLRLQEAR